MTQKVSYKEAVKIFFDLLHVWSDVTKEFKGYTGEEIKIFLMFSIHGFKTVKEMKEHVLERQGDHNKKNNVEVKLAKFLKILVSKNLVSFGSLPNDRRVKTIVLTDTGKELHKELEELIKRKWEEKNV